MKALTYFEDAEREPEPALFEPILREMSQPAPRPMSCAEYLGAEAVSLVEHEYWRGVVHAMSGGTPEHVPVSQREPVLERYRRDERGHWVPFEVGPGQSLELGSLGGVRIACEAVYRNPLAGRRRCVLAREVRDRWRAGGVGAPCAPGWAGSVDRTGLG